MSIPTVTGTHEPAAASARYTAVWLCGVPSEKNWLLEIFAPYFGDHVEDPERSKPVVDHAIVIDKFINTHDRAYYRQYRGMDAILVDLRDENYDSLPEIYANFRGVIRNCWSDVYRPETVRFLPFGYTQSFVHAPFDKASTREYVWSFIGQANKSSRPDMARELAAVEPHLLFTVDNVPGIAMWNHTAAGPRRYSRDENAAALRNSIFAPSPMGNANLECFRVYEALESGSIPIVEKRWTLDYFREALGDHPMPTVRSWREARSLIQSALREPAELDVLQQRCVAWWKQYKESYTQELGEFLERRSSQPMVLSPENLVLAKRNSPGWKARELLRHHDARAASRRVGLMATRILSGKKLRMHYSASDTAPK